MFSENQKISLRQTYRLFMFDLLGVGTLLFPTQLASLCGNAGIWCILLGGLAGAGYLLLLKAALGKMNTDLFTYMEEYLPGLGQKFLLLVLGIYSLAFAGFCACVFTDLIKWSLVPGEAFTTILVVILFVSCYAVSGGTESRARVYEVLFWFVLVPLMIMLFAAAKDVEPSLWLPVFSFQPVNLLKGTYLVFMAFSVLFYMLFFPECVKEEDRKKLAGYVGLALAITVAVLVVLYLILLGSFGAAALSNMKFPAVTLMSTVHIKGSFLKRADALMLGVWFFTLFALLNLHVYYASKVSERMVGKKGTKRYIAAVSVLVFFGAIMFEYGDEMMSKYIKILGTVGIPFLVLIPVVILLTGCHAAELEDRCFPMLAAVDYDDKEHKVVFSYEFPSEGIKSGEGKAAAGIAVSPVKRSDFEAARLEYEREVSKQPDANHLKVVLLGESFLNNKNQYEQMLVRLQQDESFPRNTYVCVSGSVKEILKQNEHLSTDIGSYLEELIENHDRNSDKKLPTIGNLIDEKDNRRRNLEIPYLQVVSDTIVWEKEYLMKQGIPAGLAE